MPRVTHWLLAKTAREMAGAQYEELAKDDAWYKAHPSQREFISAHWNKYLGVVRQVFTAMLGDENRPEGMREEIYEALIADRNANPGTRRPLH